MPSGYCAGLSGRRSLVDALVCPSDRHSQSGALVINADDWGRDRDTTDHTLECIRAGSVSSVSAMVFMEDSEGAAARAREQGIDAGLHRRQRLQALEAPQPVAHGLPQPQSFAQQRRGLRPRATGVRHPPDVH